VIFDIAQLIGLGMVIAGVVLAAPSTGVALILVGLVVIGAAVMAERAG
jgi:hypothetical protein